MAQCSWSDLPPELVDRIFRRHMKIRKIDDSKDLVRCSLVCTTWRYVIVDIWGKNLSFLSSANMMIDRRILREYQYFQIDSPKGYKVRFAESLFHWEAIMIGPQASPYAGGVFLLNIHFSDQHPFQAPNITFQTKVYHPNIDQQGRLCLETLWSPAMTISRVLLVIYARFNDPDIDDSLDFEIAQIYKTQRIRYEEKARVWTKKFATASQISSTDWSQFLKDNKTEEPPMCSDIWGKKLSLLRPDSRILKEYKNFHEDPPKDCTVEFVKNLFHWEAIMIGPQDSPYAGGVFLLNIHFSYQHPFKAPKVTFQTKVYHPNIDKHGKLCLEPLWSPATTILKVLQVIYAHFNDPDPDNPIDFEIAHIYTTQRVQYEEKARDWTKKFATTSQISVTDWSQYLKDHKIGEPPM
ncbi:ubiquitin-conjugating enzyme E2 11-like [Fagus crenata]